MADAKRLTPLDYLRQFSPDATTAFLSFPRWRLYRSPANTLMSC
jgi:hypothetical protein